MSDRTRVSGILNTGGTTSVNSSAVGKNPVVNMRPADGGGEPDSGRIGVDVGIITILDVETSAVRLALGLRETPRGALRFYTGEVASGSGPLKVAAIQTLGQGQRSAMAAYENLCRHHDPGVVVLTGIGGGIHKDVKLGDVVVATRVVNYDLRKETPEGIRRRGEERETPAAIGHAVNAFFADHEPAEFTLEDPGGTPREAYVHNGPIGSGDAVIADEDAGILRYLAAFNDKILAVDMEAGGLSQACHERSAGTDRLHGWVVVRGISDKANSSKDDDHHRIASWHAAATLRKLVPYLRIERS